MSAEAVFKSQHPDVLAAWEEWTAGNDAFRKFADAFKARYATDGRDVMMHGGGWYGQRVSGLGVSDDDNDRRAPRTRPELPGLRLGAKEGYWVPDKRTTEGRALAEEFKRNRLKRPAYPGMPREVWGDSTIYTPGSTLADGWVWVSWGCGADRLIEGHSDLTRAKENAAVDLSIWTHARLSEYHAMREAREDVA